jgi:hypothetical protein
VRTAALFIPLALIAACPLSVSPTARAEEKDVSTKPLLLLTGADSRMDKTAYHRVASAEAFRKLWLRHLGKSEDGAFLERAPALAIDFDRCMVLAIFRCEKGYSRGLNVVSVAEGKETITLRFEDLGSQVAAPLGGALPVTSVTPAYAFVVLPSSTKSVVLEEAVRDLKDQPPAWKERARLEAEKAPDKR